MASYQELVDYYTRNVDTATPAYTPVWENRFNEWIGGIMTDLGVNTWEEVPFAELANYEVVGGDSGNVMPIEQALGNQVINDYVIPDINADAGRRADVEALLQQYGGQFDAARGVVGSMLPTFDTGRYGQSNPDLIEWYNQNVEVMRNHPDPNWRANSLDEFLRKHYQMAGKAEGRPGGEMQQSALLQEELANAAVTEQARLGSLNQQMSAITANLSGELQAKAANLQQQLATLEQGLTTLTADQRAALAQQLQSNYLSLEQEVAARRDSLATELSTLQGALDTESQAKKAALQTELDALNAAQEPLNNVRLQGAQTLSTAVNLGVQNERDRIVAEAARDGFVGASSGTDAALLRASIGGRQEAALAMARAREQNAADTAGIARYGATEGRRLDDTFSTAARELTTYGAGQTRGISDYDASGRRTIADFGAGQERSIADGAARGRFDLTSYGAGERRALGDYGASQTRMVGDYGAEQRRTIQDEATARRSNYFDNDITRRIAALSLPAAALGTELQVRTAADNYAQSGLQRAMNNLNWFSTGAGGPPQTSPTFTQPVQNGWENLGAGLINVAGGIAQANNWWQGGGGGAGNNGRISYADFQAGYGTPAGTGTSSVPRVQEDYSSFFSSDG